MIPINASTFSEYFIRKYFSKKLPGILCLLTIIVHITEAQRLTDDERKQQNRLDGYLGWLNQPQRRITRFNDFISPDNIQPGIARSEDIVIVTDSQLEQCDPSKIYCQAVDDFSWYEFSSTTTFPEGVGSGQQPRAENVERVCPSGTYQRQCRFPSCNYDPNQPMADYLLTDIEPRLGLDTPISSNDTGRPAVSKCGLTVQDKSHLIFSEVNVQTCNIGVGKSVVQEGQAEWEQKEVFYQIDQNLTSQYYQVSFTLQPDPILLTRYEQALVNTLLWDWIIINICLYYKVYR